jgi:hypothetical protein
MERAALLSVFIVAASMAAIAPIGAQTSIPALAYATSGTCLNSPSGFNSKLEPIYTGTAWTTSFHAEGSIDANGVATEVGQSVDSASFGVGPRMHAPGASAYKDSFTPTVTVNSDGTYTIAVGKFSGVFTDGPFAGKTFTASPGLTFKRWPNHNGVSVQATVGAPVIQTFSLSNGTSFQRICTATTVVTSAPQ